MRAVLAIALSGCFYAPGSYHFAASPFPGKRVALRCLDIAVTMTDDDRADGPVVEYSFGNRCTHAATVDLGAVRAIGVDNDGNQTALHAFDPRHELRPLPLDPWFAASEEIMYQPEPGQPAPRVVCVDVGAAEGVDMPATHWVCVGAAS